MAGFFRDITTEDDWIAEVAHEILPSEQYSEYISGGNISESYHPHERFIASWVDSIADYNAAWDMTKLEFMIYAFTKWAQRTRKDE